MLHKFAQKSAVAREWIIADGGIDIIQTAFLSHYSVKDMMEVGLSTVYVLEGINGFSRMLVMSLAGCETGHLEIRTFVAWAVFEIFHGESGGVDVLCSLKAPNIVAGLMAVIRDAKTKRDTLWACTAALDAMVKNDNRYSCVFIVFNGVFMLQCVFRGAVAQGRNGFSVPCAILLTLWPRVAFMPRRR